MRVALVFLVALVVAPAAAPAAAKPDLVLGKKLFKAHCGVCHTLGAAGTHGKIGPNLGLETFKPATVAWMIRSGNSTMPSFAGTLSTPQIKDVAAFVAQGASG